MHILDLTPRALTGAEETTALMQSLPRPLPTVKLQTAKYLFSRNIDVLLFNYKRICTEPGQLHVSHSEDGDQHYLETILAPQRLCINVDCPVMLLIHLSDELVNGKIGTVCRLR